MLSILRERDVWVKIRDFRCVGRCAGKRAFGNQWILLQEANKVIQYHWERFDSTYPGIIVENGRVAKTSISDPAWLQRSDSAFQNISISAQETDLTLEWTFSTKINSRPSQKYNMFFTISSSSFLVPNIHQTIQQHQKSQTTFKITLQTPRIRIISSDVVLDEFTGSYHIRGNTRGDLTISRGIQKRHSQKQILPSQQRIIASR